MIPLRPSVSVERFPRLSLGLVILWLCVDVLFRLFPLFQIERLEIMKSMAFIPAKAFERPWTFMTQLLAFPNLFLCLVSVLYLWVFSPKVFESRTKWKVVLLSLLGSWLSLFVFYKLHSQSEVPILVPETFLGVLLGFYMRRDIWGTIDTYVIGWGWARVMEVPSYVLFFFWLFYLMLGNLALPPHFSDAPMIYILPLVSFLYGFLVESAWLWLDHRKTMHA